MFTTNILSACLEGHILSDNMPDHSDSFDSFKIIDDESSRLQTGRLHIGTSQAFYSATRNDWDRNCIYTVVITGGDEVMDFYTESPSFHIITTDLGMTSIINNISELSDEYASIWSLRRHLGSAASASDSMIEGAARAMKADVAYLSGRLRVISVCRTINSEEFAYLAVNEHLSSEHAAVLKDEWQSLGELTVRLAPLEFENRTSGYLLVIMHKNSREKFNSELLELLQSSMLEYLRMSFSDRSVSDSRFTTLAMDLIDGKVTDREMLNERLRRLPNTLTGSYFMILIEAENITERVPAEVIPAITGIFPGAFPIQYDNKLAVLLQVEKYVPVPQLDESALVHYLEEYRLYACVSNITRNLLSLRTDYDKSSKCLTFARTFCEDKNRRIFRAEEYAVYAMIDTCYNAVKNEYHGEYIKLCCPGAITLNYYDNKHGTNNTQLLKDYLMNDCNTTRTAADFGLHRNTLMYRLEKIQQIIGTDLEDPMQKLRMLMSLIALDYIETYQQRKTIYTPASDMDRSFEQAGD